VLVQSCEDDIGAGSMKVGVRGPHLVDKSAEVEDLAMSYGKILLLPARGGVITPTLRNFLVRPHIFGNPGWLKLVLFKTPDH
jgi:hypothetical protein